MSNPGNQNSQQAASRKNPNPVPDTLQGTDDTQSEFSVEAMREERREEEHKADDQSVAAEPAKDSPAADTQSEFSVDERLRGKS